MKKFLLNTIIKSLINNDYLTENTLFKLHLDSCQYLVSAKKLYTTGKWLLEVPVNYVYIYYKNDSVKRNLINLNAEPIHYLISYNYIRDNVMPGSKQVKTRYTIHIVCDNLPKLYVKSFLYQLNYLRPALYHVLMEYGNTVMNKSTYFKCIDYINSNKREIIKLFKFDLVYYERDEHYILEKIFSSITNFDVRIRKTDEPGDDYMYIIEKKSMSN